MHHWVSLNCWVIMEPRARAICCSRTFWKSQAHRDGNPDSAVLPGDTDASGHLKTHSIQLGPSLWGGPLPNWCQYHWMGTMKLVLRMLTNSWRLESTIPAWVKSLGEVSLTRRIRKQGRVNPFCPTPAFWLPHTDPSDKNQEGNQQTRKKSGFENPDSSITEQKRECFPISPFRP